MAYIGVFTEGLMSPSVKFLESDVWQIDKYTTQFQNSTAIRNANEEKYYEFQKKYPSAGRGYVRLFHMSSRGEIQEWMVLYEKHKLAFPYILQNPDFMKYFVCVNKTYFSPFVQGLLLQKRKDGINQVRKYCRELKAADKKQMGVSDGGVKYYTFMRDIVYQYVAYTRKRSYAKSIDQLVQQHYEDCHSESKVQESSIKELFSYFPERDPDQILFDIRDNAIPEENLLKEFLGNPNFDRYYDYFSDSDLLFLLGDAIEDFTSQERYEKWYRVCKDGFDGTICCPPLNKNSSLVSHFRDAQIVVFCISQKDRVVESEISVALNNKAEVALITYDPNLWQLYAKKYPGATLIMGKETNFQRQFEEFMIHVYQERKSKVRPKSYGKSNN